MSETPKEATKIESADWFVRGILTKFGDIFDRFTGRRWKPSSSLATSELIEAMKRIVDSEQTIGKTGGVFVPHSLILKVQWDKFSTDSETTWRQLEDELLAAVVDHINDKRYYTYAPISLKVTPDYFTSGIKLFVGFDTFDEQHSEAQYAVAAPQIEENLPLPFETTDSIDVAVSFALAEAEQTAVFNLQDAGRITVGRSRDNTIFIDDTSVSKHHAVLTARAGDSLMLADIGSTNGTFVNGARLAYGGAAEIIDGSIVEFGNVKVFFNLRRHINSEAMAAEDNSAYHVGDFVFRKKALKDSANSNGSCDKVEMSETSINKPKSESTARTKIDGIKK